MATLLSDVRYALRLWTRTPGFTALVVVTLAIGIGANTTIFSVINATLLRPLPYPEADRLVTVWQSQIDQPESRNIVSMPIYMDWKARSRSLEHLAIFDSAGRGYNLTGLAEPEQVSGVRVTASFFDVLGVRPLLGRTFRSEEEEPGRDRVVVLSHGLWTRSYGADRTLIGNPIQIDGQAYTVIGVMPPEFRFQFWSGVRQLWVPAGWTRSDRERGSYSFLAIGRLRSGVTIAQAGSELDAIGRALAKEYPENAGQTVRLVPMSEYGVTQLRPVMVAMLAVVGFVLLIACVNVANLMLARATARHREFAIRCAVGAGRGRLLRQLLTESVLLAGIGGAAGLGLAVWATTLLIPVLPVNLTFIPLRPIDRIDVDGGVLAFTTVISALSGILFGLAPAAAAFQADLSDPLKESARGSASGARSRLRYGLVASEVALTLVTLAGAGVMIMSVARLLGIDPGFDTKNLLVMDMSLPQADLYYSPPDHPQFCAQLERQVGSVPGVMAVSAIAHLPIGGGNAGRSLSVEGRPDPGPEKRPGSNYTVACPGILRALGVPLISGREFTHRDTVGAPNVVIVNETMAREFWPGEDAVGKRLQIGGFDPRSPWLTVVGVFRDIRHLGLDTDMQPWFFRPYVQAAWPSMSIVAKTATSPALFAGPIKKALAVVEPNQPVSFVRTMEEVVGESVSSRRFPMLLLSGFALIALLLAAVGIAGVVGYSVAQRTREIGVRMALGARSSDVLRLMLGHSLWWTLAGVTIGVLASLGLLRFLGTLVYGIAPADPVILTVVSVLLVAVSLGASYLPARRAAALDPVTALRYE